MSCFVNCHVVPPLIALVSLAICCPAMQVTRVYVMILKQEHLDQEELLRQISYIFLRELNLMACRHGA